MYVKVANYGNWHREKLQLDRENTGNLKIQFEWVPCWLYWLWVLYDGILCVASDVDGNHCSYYSHQGSHRDWKTCKSQEKKQ